MRADSVLNRPKQPVGAVPAGGDGQARRLRVAVVTESFLPSSNGVTTGACRTLEHLARRGHDAIVICPGPAPETFASAPVIGVPSFSYRRFPIGMPSTKVIRTLAGFAPDVVHLAAPFVLGAAGVTAAGQLSLPSVAVFSSELSGFARHGQDGEFTSGAWRWIRRIHAQADVTLAPSTPACERLTAHGVPRVVLWQRGTDGDRFTPRRRTTAGVDALRARLSADGQVLVGHLGGLTTRGQVERLAALTGLPGVQVVADGPDEMLRGTGILPLGRLDGEQLADAHAALDLFVQPGESAEDPGPGLLAAMSSGVPVVVPAGGRAAALVAPGLNGLLFGADDVAGLRIAVTGLAADDEQRRWMGIAARVGLERRTWERLGDELIGHYRTAIARRPPAMIA
jgi:phosphatidylinositol alpha 1,6-mannosyltransferase